MEAMQKQNANEMAEQMKKMGMDPGDFNMGGGYDDPELAELDREMRKRGKLFWSTIDRLYLNCWSIGFVVEQGAAGITMDDEAAMLAELDRELGIEPQDPAERAKELKT